MPILYMIVATALWGSSFLLTKLALQHVSTTTFILLRFAIATFAMLPSLGWSRIPIQREAIIQGIQLGILQGGMIFLQTLGLKTISTALSAFLSGCFIAFVLVIRFVVQRILPTFTDLFASLLCLAGLVLLTHSYELGWELGVLYTIGCACFLALHTYFLEAYVSAGNAALLTFMQMLTVTTLVGIASLLADHSIQLPTQLNSWGAILFCGIFCSSVAFWLQARAQESLGAFQVAMILMLEPIFATVFAYLVLGEELSRQAYIGIVMIIGAISIINTRLKSIA